MNNLIIKKKIYWSKLYTHGATLGVKLENRSNQHNLFFVDNVGTSLKFNHSPEKYHGCITMLHSAVYEDERRGREEYFTHKMSIMSMMEKEK